MPRNAVIATILVALLLGACGSSASTTRRSSSGTTTAASPVAPSTASSAPATTAPTTPATTTSAGRPSSTTPRCTATSLTPSYLGQQGAAGHGELGFALRNTGSVPCHTFGYPGVLFLSNSGQPLNTVSTRTTHDLFGPAPVVALVVAPGSTVSFRLGVTHGIASSAGCTTAYGLQVIPPDDTATVRTTIGQGGAYECGTATVSPLRPGRSAFP